MRTRARATRSSSGRSGRAPQPAPGRGPDESDRATRAAARSGTGDRARGARASEGAVARSSPRCRARDGHSRAAIDDRPPARRAPGERTGGGPAAENRDLERALGSRLPLVVGVSSGLGFLLLVVLLRAPLAAAAAVGLNLLATAAAFGVARLVFQEGALERLLGFESQGFVDAWAPIFFFALVFALAMDYTVFLLATVKEVLSRTGDVREAVVEGSRQDGPRDQRRGGGHGRGVHDVRARRPAATEGDGRHPRGRGPARRHAGPAAVATGRPAASGPARLVDARLVDRIVPGVEPEPAPG